MESLKQILDIFHSTELMIVFEYRLSIGFRDQVKEALSPDSKMED